jgi:hypothetical protein
MMDIVAGLESRHKELLDIEFEAFSVDRSIKDAKRVDPVAPQGRRECERLPMPVRRLSAQALSSRSPAMGAEHVGLGPGLIDEDAVDGPRIAGRASAKNSGNVVPTMTPGGHRRPRWSTGSSPVGTPAMTTGQILLLLGSGACRPVIPLQILRIYRCCPKMILKAVSKPFARRRPDQLRGSSVPLH